MSNLTTHVLDTSQGKPAEGMKVQLFKIEDKKSFQIAEVITNKDGRVDQKLLKSENNIGIYELRFFAGDYFNKENLKLTKIKFLDEIRPSSYKSKLELTQKLNQVIEKMIAKNPYQWIWTHNRWK